MEYAFDFLIDRTLRGKIYPALTIWQARPYTPEWWQFGEHWPYTVPLRVQEYCTQHGVTIRTHTPEDTIPDRCYYPIALAFFDFSIDYVSLLPVFVHDLLKQRKIKVLFFYHEGDNPLNIKQRLDHLFAQRNLAPDSYVFVSSNSSATHLPGFVYFVDFELWYFQRNLNQQCVMPHLDPRSRNFTALSRIHKWWRAVVMADLDRHGLLESAYWSYCERPDHQDLSDCPIEIDSFPGLRQHLFGFVNNAPYVCDDLDPTQKNDHSTLVHKHFHDSYCNIVIESQFDVDQSQGAFLTEKTFKAIKHAQMFFIAGGAGSVQTLRDLGYCTFDSILNHDYDLEQNSTRRWAKLLHSIQDAHQQGLHKLYCGCLEEIYHNQKLFCDSKKTRLNNLIKQIHEQHR